MLKNVSVSDVIRLVILAIPQFLMYTMPFSSLSSASMVIGNFSSQNEILAFRSNGIHTVRIFFPIVFVSVFISIGTLFIADKLIPYTALQYRYLYSRMIQNIPTLELESYSTTQFGNIIISNGKVDGNIINDVMIFDDSVPTDSRIIVSDKAEISVRDINKFLYQIDLDNPEIFITDADSKQDFSIAKASHLTLNIDLASNSDALVSINPSQMSLHELKNLIIEKEPEHIREITDNSYDIAIRWVEIGKDLMKIENNANGGLSTSVNKLINDYKEYDESNKFSAYSFYYQYFKSEYHKKIALSVACTILVFVAFPLSFFKIRYGRLVGFGLSMFCACIYWFFLYYMHLKAVNSALNPAVLLWLPNVVIFICGFMLIKLLGKN